MHIALEWNPILTREVRARWRGWRAFALMFGYSVLVATVMALIYASNTHSGAEISLDPTRRASVLGHTIFSTLTWMQTLCWMLLAPSLTATSIAGERERGLLEGLQLSRLSAPRIIAGKMLSALSFIALMMLVPIPIVALCFLMGGVSPGEFGAALLVQAATAGVCAAIGILCSAWSRRAGSAMSASMGWVIVWGVSSAIARFLTMIPPLNFVLKYVCAVYAMTNPIYASLDLLDANFARNFGTPGFTWWLPLGLPPWLLTVFLLSLVTLLLCRLAAWGVRKPFGEQYWRERTAAPQAASRAVPGGQTTAQATTPTRRGGRWEMPFAAALRFANPVLQRELRSRLRVRQMPLWLLCLHALVVLCLAYPYFLVLRLVLSEPSLRRDLWEALAYACLLLLMVVAALIGASTFSREREAGTWEAIGLSLLSRRAIIIGKIGTPLLLCCLCSLPFWPLMALCTDYTHLLYRYDRGMPLEQAVAALLITGASIWFCTAWGMLFSWPCKRTAAATGWALSTLCGALVMVPLFASLIAGHRFDTATWWWLWHPVFALARLLDSGRPGSLAIGLLSALIIFGAGCCLLAILHVAMRDGVREKDRRSGLEASEAMP